MQETPQDLLEQLQKLLSQKKSNAFYASRLGISEEEVKSLKEELREEKWASPFTTSDDAEIGNYIAELEHEMTRLIGQEVNHVTGDQTLIAQSSKPLSPKEIEELAQTDGINTYVARSWLKSHRNNTWTYSIDVRTVIKNTEFQPKDFADYLKGYSPTPIKITFNTSKEKKQKVDVEISLTDFHLDRLTLSLDSIESRKNEFLSVLQNLSKSINSTYSVDKLVFVIGNDFFNTDTFINSTTNGTPQDVSVTWNKVYEEGFDLLAKSITFLSYVCEQLEVILVQGNHDRTKSFYLAHALDIYFQGNDSIHFDRESSNTKYTKLGSTFIGYHHGNTKIDDLPLLFATSLETSKSFGASTYREIHTGDKHYYLTKEVKGVRIQQLPSLVNPDRWSTDNNYVNNIRAGLALVYHPEKGKIAEFEERI